MYKAVIFDLGDTLYDYQSIHPVAVERLRAFTCARLGILADAFDEAFAWAKVRTKELAGSTGAGHNRLLCCQKTLERLGRNPADGAEKDVAASRRCGHTRMTAHALTGYNWPGEGACSSSAAPSGDTERPLLP